MNTSPLRFASRWTGFDWLLIVVGLGGTCLVGLSAPALVGGVPKWWFTSAFGGDKTANYLLLYAGLLCTIGSWIGIGWRINDRRPTRPGDLIAVVILWSLPLLVAPPLFSGDVYSYLAQGTLAHLGLNPYHATPAALAHLHRVGLENAVSPFWRHSTSPYGPLFIGAMSVIAALTSSVELGVILARLVEVLGVLAFAFAVPRIARSCGADPVRAVWLCVLSPLTLFGLLAPGHNDALMIGLMTLGVAAALEHRPVVGVTFCMIASAIKAPAAVAAVVILICWLRSEGSRTDRWRRGVAAVTVAAAVLVISSLATGFGFAWLSPSVLATPGRVHLAITPVSEVAWLVHAIDASISIPTAQSSIGKVAFAIAGVIGIWMLRRVRQPALARTAGIILLVLAALGPAAWPWYFTWGIALVACDPRFQRSRTLIVGVVLGSLVIKPDGILALSYSTSAIVLGAYLVCAIGAAGVLHGKNSNAANSAAGHQATNVGT
jgi:hypothetical protein